MESTPKQMRAILPLGKARVVDRTESYIRLALGGSTTMTIYTDMRNFDIRDGDLLSIYTEVLLAKPQG
jgi:hypothetical protein